MEAVLISYKDHRQTRSIVSLLVKRLGKSGISHAPLTVKMPSLPPRVDTEFGEVIPELWTALCVSSMGIQERVIIPMRGLRTWAARR